jgi:hypothetical protein
MKSTPHNCPYHSSSPAVSLGPRCGDFLCQDCILNDPKDCCRNCAPTLEKARKHRKVHGLLFIAVTLFGSIVIFFLQSLPGIFVFIGLYSACLLSWMITSPHPKGPSPGAEHKEAEL